MLAAGCIHPDSKEKYEVICPVPIAPTPDIVRGLCSSKTKTGKAGEPITENRNIRLMSIAGKWRNDGMTEDCLIAALLQFNADLCVPPLDEEEVTRIAHNAAKYDVPERVGEVVIGKPAAPPASIPEHVKPTYPIEVWDGTAVGEFAKLSAHDNNIPPKLHAESFRCALGAVVGDRLSCSTVESLAPRSYTVIVAPKGKGKGTAIRRAVRFFSQPWYGTRETPGLTVQGALRACCPVSGTLTGSRKELARG